MYVELHSASAFSFLEGASLPEEMAERCAESGMPAMALLDRNGLYGAPRFHLGAKKCGVRAHIGAEVTSAEYRVPSTQTNARSLDSRSPRKLGSRSPGRTEGNGDSQLGTRYYFLSLIARSVCTAC